MGDCGIDHAIKKRMQEILLDSKARNPESSNPEEEYYERLFLPDFIKVHLKKRG